MPTKADLLMIFEKTGDFPPGIHDFSSSELRSLLCFNDHRSNMWSRMVEFLSRPELPSHKPEILLGGGFLSKKPHPVDLDLILQTKTPYGPKAIAAIAGFFAIGLDTIWETYGVHLHFWMENCPPFLADYRRLFQYKRSDNEDVHLTVVKGIVRFKLE